MNLTGAATASTIRVSDHDMSLNELHDKMAVSLRCASIIIYLCNLLEHGIKSSNKGRQQTDIAVKV
jgi:hypothetical protein